MKKLSSVFVIIGIIAAMALSVSSIKIEAEAGTESIHMSQEARELTNYVDDIAQLNQQLALMNQTIDTVDATITFADYLSLEELETYIAAYDIDIHQMQVRGLMPDGERVTVFTLVHRGLDATQKIIYEDARVNGYKIIGITDVYVSIPTQMVALASEDALTYLVDTSGDETVAVNILNSAKTVSTSTFPKSLTWELEDLDILTY